LQNTYIIEAKARDIFGTESGWATLSVTMPKNKLYINTPFLQFLENLMQRLPLFARLLTASSV
jgi:hypothetical protein